MKDQGLADVSDRQKNVAYRQWTTATQHLTQALEKIVMMANDEGQLTDETAELYSTSCTANSASYTNVTRAAETNDY